MPISTDGELQAPPTSKDTSSSLSESESDKLRSSLAAVPTWSADSALNFKPLSTASKKKLASMGPGGSASQPTIILDDLPAYSPSAKRSRTESTSAIASIEIPPLGFGTVGASKRSPIVSNGVRGATSLASTSAGPQGPGSQLSSTTQLVTSTFTLSQAQRLFGSTRTQASVFSSLTSLMETFRGRYSYGHWTVILTRLLSKEGTSTLATLASFFAPTSTTTSTSVQSSSDDSSEEDSSDSSDGEESIEISLSDSEERSGSDSEYQRVPIKRSQLRREYRRFWNPPVDSDSE